MVTFLILLCIVCIVAIIGLILLLKKPQQMIQPFQPNSQLTTQLAQQQEIQRQIVQSLEQQKQLLYEKTSSLSLQLQENQTKTLAIHQHDMKENTELFLNTATETLKNQTEILKSQSALHEQKLSHDTHRVEEKTQKLQDQLSELAKVLNVLRQESSQQKGEIQQALTHLSTKNEQLALSTKKLHEVLSNTSSRGRWGEHLAEEFLLQMGLIEGIHFVTQKMDQEGKKPDITFLLTDGRVLHMDIKFPANNYLLASKSTQEFEQKRYMELFKSDVRNRVKEVTRREYDKDKDSLDFILLFVPVESIMSVVYQNDPDLFQLALEQKVVLCSPSSLFGVLTVVKRAVDAYRMQKHIDGVLNAVNEFEGEWRKFETATEKVKKDFDAVQRDFTTLTTTRLNVMNRKLQKLEILRGDRNEQVLLNDDPNTKNKLEHHDTPLIQ